jgi:hypothetical protein
VAVWQGDDGSVLSDNTVNKFQAARDGAEVRKNPPRYDDDDHSSLPSVPNGLTNGWMEDSIRCNRPIIVNSDRSQAHRFLHL